MNPASSPKLPRIRNLRDHRLARGETCPVCGKDSWCLAGIDDDGRPWALCQRIESDRPWKDAGWFHWIDEPSSSSVRPVLLGRSTSRGKTAPARRDHGEIIERMVHYYNAEDGEPLYRKHRRKYADGYKAVFFERYAGGPLDARSSWRGGKGAMEGVPRVLYHLERLLQSPGRRVFIAEGEKCCDLLHDLGLLATCNDDGAGKWRDSYNAALAGREAVILPDADEKGRAHADLVAEHLAPVARRVKILELPGLEPKGDVYDWIMRRGDTL